MSLSTSFSIASLCVFGFDGFTVPDWIRRLILKKKLAGVILFKRNVQSIEQVTALNRELASLNPEIPLLISVDHEGGRVFRLPPPFTLVPPARELAENPDQIFALGFQMGQELRAAGFNLNFAPVLDVDTNPENPVIGDRSFGESPELVIRSALELARGLRKAGVLPCGKHFPGHGDTVKDSHHDLPYVDHPVERLFEVEIEPFRAAVASQIEMLMTAHVMYPALDPDFPATLSAKILGEILRDRLGYQGVVISDDFLMKAIFDRFPLADAVELFWQAGGDLALVCREEETCMGLVEALEKRVEDRNISLGLLEKAFLRVEALRKVLKQDQKK